MLDRERRRAVPAMPDRGVDRNAADELFRRLQPASVLQVGGTREGLLERLQAVGVDTAFLPDVTAAPPGRAYDIVLVLGSLDGVDEAEVAPVLAALRAVTTRVILASPPPAGRRARRTARPLLHWLGRFGEAGFTPACDFDAGFIAPTAVLLQAGDPVRRDILASAELATLRGQVADLQAEAVQLQARLAYGRGGDPAGGRGAGEDGAGWRAFRTADHERRLIADRLRLIEASTAWRLTGPLRRALTVRPGLRAMLVGPPKLVWWTLTLQLQRRLRARREFFQSRAGGPAPPASAPTLPAPAGSEKPASTSVDIIVCVHNALDDVRRCLASILANTLPPYRLLIIDDGSAEPTRDFLAGFARDQGALLERNEAAKGYTFAANQGMRLATSSWLVLLNSDTIVTMGWLDRMVSKAADPRVGAVGPLSNIASWQSVPRIADGGDWPENPLPDDIDIARMGRLVAEASGGTGAPLPFLNGFCMLLRRAMLDEIGLFDEAAFGAGYGEENDLCIRARIAGWTLMVAADVFIFHAQSKSYSHERRLELAKRADAALRAKHDPALHVSAQVGFCQHSLAMISVRARAAAAIDRFRLIAEGRRRWEGRRLAFVMPVLSVGGGANVVFQEARALRRMGVDAWLINLAGFAEGFAASYPGFDLPVAYADGPDGVAEVASDPAYGFDAVVATHYRSVFWLPEPRPGLRRAYYIQDYEPLFFEPGDPEREIAFQSYQHAEDIAFLTKTGWNADQVESAASPRPAVVGASVDVDLFKPAAEPFGAASRPVRVCAMVRPSSPRRGPARTLQVLRRLKARFGGAIRIEVFGTSDREPENAAMDFSGMVSLGEIDRTEMAELLRNSDVFLDFSDYQAMGLTALEAMCSGCAAVLPKAGGAGDFARDEVNCLLVDTADIEACYGAAERLVADGELRGRLQRTAIADSSVLAPEAAAFRLMDAIFGEEGDGLAASAPRP